MEVIRSVRNRRAEMNVPPSKKAELIITADQRSVFENAEMIFKKPAYASQVTFTEKAPQDSAGMVSVVTSAARVYMPMSDLVDIEKELARLNKEKENILNQISRTENKLNNEGFVSKAPEAVVQAERQKLSGYREHLTKLEESISNLR